MYRIVTFLLAIVALTCPTLAEGEVSMPTGRERGATDKEIENLMTSELRNNLVSGTPLAFSTSDLTTWSNQAKQAHASLTTEAGDLNTSYDLVLQPGHFPRTKGRTGGQGAYVSEQEYVAWIAQMMSSDLKKRGVNVVVIPADGYAKPLKSKIFLSLHTDAREVPCQIGPSVGYHKDSDATGMHGIALALALSLGVDPIKFMRDSYTPNLKGYYALKDMDTSLFQGVLEMSELTCPDQENLLLSHAKTLASNLAIATVFALRKPQN
jgi:N-acetylmuramoyl-L-alanine amidase